MHGQNRMCWSQFGGQDSAAQGSHDQSQGHSQPERQMRQPMSRAMGGAARSEDTCLTLYSDHEYSVAR